MNIYLPSSPIAPSGAPLDEMPQSELWYASARVSVSGVRISFSLEQSSAAGSASLAHFQALTRRSSPQRSIHSRLLVNGGS